MRHPAAAPLHVSAAGVRDASEWVGRLAFYTGVPGWLALRLLSGG